MLLTLTEPHACDSQGKSHAASTFADSGEKSSGQGGRVLAWFSSLLSCLGRHDLLWVNFGG